MGHVKPEPVDCPLLIERDKMKLERKQTGRDNQSCHNSPQFTARACKIFTEQEHCKSLLSLKFFQSLSSFENRLP